MCWIHHGVKQFVPTTGEYLATECIHCYSKKYARSNRNGVISHDINTHDWAIADAWKAYNKVL